MRDLEQTVAQFEQEMNLSRARQRYITFLSYLDSCHTEFGLNDNNGPESKRQVRCKPLSMLQHDIDSKLGNINGLASILLEDFPTLPSSYQAALYKTSVAAKKLGALLNLAIENPRRLLSSNKGVSHFKQHYDTLLTQMPTDGLESFSSRDRGEINAYINRIDAAQTQVQKLIASHLNYGHKVGHFDLMEYAQKYELQIGAVLHRGDSLFLPEKLVPAIDTLFQNIQKANADIMTITYAPSECGAYVHIDFTDNGIGIHPDHLSKIFDDGFSGFNQLGLLPTTGKNTGKGLGYSRKLAVKCGGDLDVHKTDLGVGTTFRLSIPVEHVRYQSNSV